MLFCVTTRGRESTFSKPRDSAIVRIRSIRILLVALTSCRPLVGPVAPRFENNGIVVPPEPPPLTMYDGVTPPTAVGVLPTPCAPPTADGPLPQPNPICTPMSRA